MTLSGLSCRQNVSGPHLRIGIASWAGFGAGFVAENRQLFDGLTLDQKIIDDSSARQAAFRSGQVDVVISSIDVFAQELSQGIQGQIILITDESFGGDGIVTTADIKTVADLKGKRVAFARGTPSHFFLFKVLQKYGLTIDDIKTVAFEDPGQAGQAFLGGAVDAAVTFEPIMSEVAGKRNGHILVTSRDFPGVIVDVLVATPRLLEDHSVTEKLIRGWIRGAEYTDNNPETAAKIISAGLKLPPTDTKAMMSGLRFAGSAQNRILLCGKGGEHLAEQILRDAAQFWRDQGVIKNIPDLRNRVSDRACVVLGCRGN